MRLFAAIVPPPEVLAEVSGAVREGMPLRVEEPPRKGLFRRPGRGAHVAGRPVPVRGADGELDETPVDTLHIPITNFGNVTLADSVRLTDALRRAARGWPRPRVHFAGGTALEFKGDESVWAKLDGDVETLMGIGRGVPQTVQQLGFFVDRRVFRPWLSVGTITEQTTAPYLEGVVGALDRLRSSEWTIEHVSLMERPAEAVDSDAFVVREQLPLGGA